MNKKTQLLISLMMLALVSYGIIWKTLTFVPSDQAITLTIDHRAGELERFMNKYKCPKPYYIQEYLNAADKFQLDYRLLPAISIRESSCGKHYRYNNYWGWNSAKTGFESVPSGIDFVAGRLAESRYYKGKTIANKLKTYNSENPNYWREVLRLMQEMKPVREYKITL